MPRKSSVERYRGLLLGIAGAMVVGLVGAFVFVGATAKSYSCANVWEPDPTPSADPSASPDFGYVQPNQGAGHNPQQPHRYVYCPPASGPHKAVQGAGPIQSRVYGPDDFAEPQGWVHNLEHGALVLLYRCDETTGPTDPCAEEHQTALRSFYGRFPNSPICNIAPGGQTPVFARFDDMAWPYAALVWGRVLPLQTLDTALIEQFWAAEGERTNPEKFCADPNASQSPTPGGSVAPSGSPAPSGSVAPTGSAAPSGSVAPSGSGAPAGSAAPSASPAAS
jgi:hypothetical protein